MVSIEEGTQCKNDNDCPTSQYCYDVSGRCVDYTLCERYNRQETRNSRHPKQCGPCLSGYITETLATGEEGLICKKMSTQDDNSELPRVDNVFLILITACIILLFTILGILGMFLKKRSCSEEHKDKSKQWNEICVYKPTAPVPEHSPFIAFERHNNNGHLMDKNALVSAIPFKNPSWIGSNPNYENHLSDESINSAGSEHTSLQMPQDEENSSNRNQEQLEMRVSNRQLAIQMADRQEIATEQTDNSTNMILMQGSYTLPASGADTTNDNPSTESSNADDSRERRNRTSNVIVNQSITMNVNVLNGDF